MIISLYSIIDLFQILKNGVQSTRFHIINIIKQNSYVIILTNGMMVVIITSEIHYSVGYVASYIRAIVGLLLVSFALPVFLAIIICLLLGALIGAWQGFWTAYLKIPSFIVTLAGMLIFRGLTLVVLGGRTLAPFPDGFRALSSSFVPDAFGGGELQLLTIFIGI